MPLSIGMAMNIGGGICCGVDMEIEKLGKGFTSIALSARGI